MDGDDPERVPAVGGVNLRLRPQGIWILRAEPQVYEEPQIYEGTTWFRLSKYACHTMRVAMLR